tara:strand:+ start:691 stop:1929 length:1239 start_codon:yes stop_codon:yes gene_type:complete
MRFFLYLIIICLFSACIEPNDPISENDIVDLVVYQNTYGEALDIDLTDEVMIVAANYQGFIVYDLDRNSQNNIIAIDSIYNDFDMASDMGDNRAQQVAISSNHEIAFITDIYDRIWIYKFAENSSQYVDNYLSDCYGGTWLSTTIDDQLDHINVFSLVKHSSSEDDNGETIGDFDQYSTSIVWKGIYDISPSDLFPEQNSTPSCEFTYNFGILPDKIHFNNGLLAVSNGELGVNVLKQTDQALCLDDLNMPIDGFIQTGDIVNDKIICEQEYDQYYNPGLNGNYEPSGGFYPYIFSSFDLPGEVSSILVRDSIIFAGLSTSNGCYMSLLDNDGTVLDKLSIANGYTINNISEDNGYLALSSGHDGVLLYKYFGGIDTQFIGQINTPYSNNVKVDGNNLIVSTEDGIYIYLIK